MQFYSRLLVSALMPVFLVAQAPVASPKALVAEYAAVLKNIPEAMKTAKDNPDQPSARSILLDVSARIAHESRPENRQVLLVARYFMFQAFAPEPGTIPSGVADHESTVLLALGVELAGQVPSESPALDLVAVHQPGFLSYLAWHASGIGFGNGSEASCLADAYGYLDRVFKNHPSKEVKALALVSAVETAANAREYNVLEDYLKRLEGFEPNHPAVAKWKQWLADIKYVEKNPVRAGMVVPAFTLKRLGDANETMTPATFKGKYLLLDFWATWCGPCKAELPFVHKAYAKYRPAGLEILSISCDKNADDIAKFRKDTSHPMPWNHAFPQGEEAKGIMKMFQVQGIPHVLLIGPDGKILELGENLRGDKLDLVLARYLNPKK